MLIPRRRESWSGQARTNNRHSTDIEDDTSFNSLAENTARMRYEGASVEWSVRSGVDALTAIMDEAAVWQSE